MLAFKNLTTKQILKENHPGPQLDDLRSIISKDAKLAKFILIS